MNRKNYYISLLVLIAILFTSVQAQAAQERHRRNSHVVVTGPRFRTRASVVTPIRARHPRTHRSAFVITLPRITVIPRPASVRVPAISVTVWVNNSNGSRSPVLLTQEGPWSIGPRGERYFGIPSEEQLRPLYGLNIKPIQPTELTIYIAASNGALIPVTLIANEDGFIGPRGELYTSMPSEKQLRMVYGK